MCFMTLISWVKSCKWHSLTSTTRKRLVRWILSSTSPKKYSHAKRRALDSVQSSGQVRSSKSSSTEGMEDKTQHMMITSVREWKNSAISWVASRPTELKLSNSALRQSQATQESWTWWLRSRKTRWSCRRSSRGLQSKLSTRGTMSYQSTLRLTCMAKQRFSLYRSRVRDFSNRRMIYRLAESHQMSETEEITSSRSSVALESIRKVKQCSSQLSLTGSKPKTTSIMQTCRTEFSS